jgi:hypothetical protein
LKGKRRGVLEKKNERTSEKNYALWERRVLGNIFTFAIQNLPNLEKLINYTGLVFGRIYMNSLNSIYVVILFSK